LTALTDLIAPVDAPHAAALWTIAQVADRDGISKQAVSKKVRRLADAHGLYVERDAQGRVVKLNVVQYDQLRGRLDDPAHKQAPKKADPAPAPAADSYDEARRTQAWLAAERERLTLDELKRNVVRVAEVREAHADAGGIIAGTLDRLPNIADDLAAAVARDGSHGARVALTKEAARLRAEIADALRKAMTAIEKGGAAQTTIE
jgi:DNA-binding transcriptional ArsR family regulator